MARLPICACALALSGCAVLGGESPEPPESAERLGATTAALTVAEIANGGCSTSAVAGLSQQIIAEGACAAPGAYVAVPDAANVTFGGAVLRFLEAPARAAFAAAVAAEPALAMQVNSMLRTVAQQYLLYKWYLAGSCGIGLAATPGHSNHETGLALDVSPYDVWRPSLEAHGFAWLGSSDVVHFDYVGADAVDYRGVDVAAFQTLWNRNHPEAPVTVDGAYGPQTEAALQASPADGFALGADCGGGPGFEPGLGTGGAGGTGAGTGAAPSDGGDPTATSHAGCALAARGARGGSALAFVAFAGLFVLLGSRRARARARTERAA